MMGSDACTWGMVGLGLIVILLVVALILGIAALVKYLFFSKPRKSAE
jgi:flagellar basal body-associated protein FliL